MGRWIVCLLVLGLANILTAKETGLDDVSQTDVKEIEAEIAEGEVSPDSKPSEKTKRGVAKLSNADNPSFNHLSSSGSSTLSSSSKGASTITQTPYRYFYNNQYYQSNPYVSYFQSPHAAQVAAQYSFQPSSIAHYFQTPTQIQYVSNPSLARGYQSASAKSGASGSTVASTGSAAATATQYHVTPTQQLYLSMPQVYQAQSSSASSHSTSAQSASAAQYQAPQQYYYPQQPIVMLLVQPQPQPVFYPGQQHHQMAYVLGQQPLLNLYGGHRFALPYTTPNSQVTYLVPMTVHTTSSASQAVNTAASVKPAEKSTVNIQSPSTVSYGSVRKT